MITYKKGNLLEANVEALVNTVNTVGVMGKGIALMFKEQFPDNMKNYQKACKQNLLHTGKMFITERTEKNPRWIINFPTKQHWKNPSKLEWITEGLLDLRQIIQSKQIKSIAIPPLGAGQGGLPWESVKKQMESILQDMTDVNIIIYEPTETYQNITANTRSKMLTPARALIAELVRRYWIIGMECSLLEIQKLAWFLERAVKLLHLGSPLKCNFKAHYYGPYADNLRHLLNNLEGNYLLCEKKINDAKPTDVIWFNEKQRESLKIYLESDEMKPYQDSLEFTSKIIDGFESAFGMELLATIDWLISQEDYSPNVDNILKGLGNWMNERASKRKLRLFNREFIEIALNRLQILKH